ncbi:cytochrome P450 [Streptomyces sp. NPDC007901]|uniref:cytochrome P450 n=1 Tax=Streptomyces sp. NPDC007901 TaxID=3364785 RepID=UPI0036E64697
MRINAGPPRAVTLDGADLFDPHFHSEGDPHAVWAYMREHAPLHRQTLPDGRAFWSVTRHVDACRVLGDHREFTSARGSLLAQLGTADAATGRMLVATDPPRHTQLRRPLNRLFSGPALHAAENRIRRAVRTVLAPAAREGRWDLARRAGLLPMAVASALMDLPEEDGERLLHWTGMAAAPEDPAYRVAGAGTTLAVAHHQLFAYFAELVARRRGTTGEDAIRLLLTMRADDGPLSDEEAVVNCYSLLLGANATTPHAVAGTVLALMEHPEQYAAAREDRSLVPGLVEEGLRWTSPASSFLRYAVVDAELSGGVVRPGDAVAVWVGSANRDERVFTDPYRFDIRRTGNRHIAFGFGPHYCLGAAVGRLTLRLFFEEAVDTVEEFRSAGPPRHLVSNFIAGLAELPVRTRP